MIKWLWLVLFLFCITYVVAQTKAEPIKINNRWGLAHNGALIVEPKFTSFELIENTFYLFRKGKKSGICDKKGNWILPVSKLEKGIIRDYMGEIYHFDVLFYTLSKKGKLKIYKENYKNELFKLRVELGSQVKITQDSSKIEVIAETYKIHKRSRKFQKKYKTTKYGSWVEKRERYLFTKKGIPFFNEGNILTERLIKEDSLIYYFLSAETKDGTTPLIRIEVKNDSVLSRQTVVLNFNQVFFVSDDIVGGVDSSFVKITNNMKTVDSFYTTERWPHGVSYKKGKRTYSSKEYWSFRNANGKPILTWTILPGVSNGRLPGIGEGYKRVEFNNRIMKPIWHFNGKLSPDYTPHIIYFTPEYDTSYYLFKKVGTDSVDTFNIKSIVPDSFELRFAGLNYYFKKQKTYFVHVFKYLEHSRYTSCCGCSNVISYYTFFSLDGRQLTPWLTYQQLFYSDDLEKYLLKDDQEE